MSLVAGDEGWIGTSKKLLCFLLNPKKLCNTCMALSHSCLTIGPIKLFISFYLELNGQTLLGKVKRAKTIIRTNPFFGHFESGPIHFFDISIIFRKMVFRPKCDELEAARKKVFSGFRRRSYSIGVSVSGGMDLSKRLI